MLCYDIKATSIDLKFSPLKLQPLFVPMLVIGVSCDVGCGDDDR